MGPGGLAGISLVSPATSSRYDAALPGCIVRMTDSPTGGPWPASRVPGVPIRPTLNPKTGPQRAGPDASAPGTYEPVLRFSKNVLDPGDCPHVEVFFTGYGTIGGSKLAFYPPSQLIDREKSRMYQGFHPTQDGEKFGLLECAIGDNNSILSLTGGIERAGSREMWFYADVLPGNPPVLATELILGRAAIEYDLQIRADAPAGAYDLQFVFTYFNGAEWKSVTVAETLAVRNFWQRHEQFVVLLGALAAIATFLALIEPAIKLVQWIAGWWPFTWR